MKTIKTLGCLLLLLTLGACEDKYFNGTYTLVNYAETACPHTVYADKSDEIEYYQLNNTTLREDHPDACYSLVFGVGFDECKVEVSKSKKKISVAMKSVHRGFSKVGSMNIQANKKLITVSETVSLQNHNNDYSRKHTKTCIYKKDE